MTGGGGGFLACKNFFFAPLPVQEFFLDCSAMHEIFQFLQLYSEQLCN